jgi:vacuolar-type H+-ATPase subunit F/Vma7
MTQAQAHTDRTRMIFMGEPQLTDGFRLIGFETWADPGVEEVERMVREMIARRQSAFLVIDQRLAAADIPAIQQVRRGGGHIVVTTVPPLNRPDSFHMMIDQRIQSMFAAAGSDTKG